MSSNIKLRQLPKLMACMTKNSLENMRNKALFCLDVLDAKGIRRRKLPLHECLILELREAGFTDSSDYFQDLIYDNTQLVANDDIGIVVDLRKRTEYLEHIAENLTKAEKERDKGDTKKECLHLLNLARHYAEKGKGILWLAEKFYMAAIAVSSQYLIDGGRLKGCCKFHYAKFLLDKSVYEHLKEICWFMEVTNEQTLVGLARTDKFDPLKHCHTKLNKPSLLHGDGPRSYEERVPGADTEEPYQILTEVRDSAIGKKWPLYEPSLDNISDEEVPSDILFEVTAIQLHRVLLALSRAIRKNDPGRSERLARLAERRAKDANETAKVAEAITEIGICQLVMKNLNNAQKTFDRAFKLHTESNNIEGLCDTRMHMAAVQQKLGDHEQAAKLLTEMGAMAMDHGLRRHLGRALHLLGELHLKGERPELGTQHLQEAFSCFMGTSWQQQYEIVRTTEPISTLALLYKSEVIEIYEEEAEQSRLMMAISAGQEHMASYFDMLRESAQCIVAQAKIIEWKLQNARWWVKRNHHDFVPCLCPVHNRSPLDVWRAQMEIMLETEKLAQEESIAANLARNDTLPDIQKLRSSRIVN